jgi:hypothetical protein
MGVLTKLNRYQAIRTPLNGSRDVVSHDTCPASSNGSVDKVSVQPSLLQQVSSCPFKGHLLQRPVTAGLGYRLDSLPVHTNSSSIQPLEHFILTNIR